ncbi:MAG: hypothetical protein LBJ46_03125 [Planctomycetota bacterium]|nr:hypothetical protein [Planctomycetota bacterium]
MKRKLLDIAKQLSERELEQLMQLKRDGGKKLQELRKERRKVAAELARIDRRIAQFGGEPEAETGKPVGAKAPSAAKKRGRPKKAEAKPRGRRKGPRRGKGLTEGVMKVLEAAAEPLRASDIVDALPGAGFKVEDVKEARKRVSIVLASKKDRIENVGRGLYKLA